MNWYSAPSENRCGDVATIRRDECTRFFTEAMDECDPNNGEIYSATGVGDCILYVIYLSCR
jgi:hypothetical protein